LGYCIVAINGEPLISSENPDLLFADKLVKLQQLAWPAKISFAPFKFNVNPLTRPPRAAAKLTVSPQDYDLL
jgi:hypothetical protein